MDTELPVAAEPGIAFPTGGTTGLPKAAVWSHAGLSFGLQSACMHLAISRGDTELYMRMLFRHVPRNKWNEWVKQMNTFSGLAGEVSELNVSDPAQTHEAFKIDYKIEAANFLDWSKKKSDFPLPLSQINLADVDQDSADPVKIGSPIEYVYRLRLEFPARSRIGAWPPPRAVMVADSPPERASAAP